MAERRLYLATLPEFATTSSRLSFLYSSLAPRKAANPTGFSSAVGWWRALLLDLVAKGHLGEDKLILVADDALRESLRWERIGRPSSLGTILVRSLRRISYIELTCKRDSPSWRERATSFD